MGYPEALEAAGATVHVFKEFGSYQGTWLAKVTFEDKTGWIEGSYGSCSGCDAFCAEFDYDSHDCGGDTYYSPLYSGFRDGCAKCDELRKRLAEFGRGYLNGLVTHEHLLGIYREKCKGEYAWEDDKEILAWLEKYGAEVEGVAEAHA